MFDFSVILSKRAAAGVPRATPGGRYACVGIGRSREGRHVAGARQLETARAGNIPESLWPLYVRIRSEFRKGKLGFKQRIGHGCPDCRKAKVVAKASPQQVTATSPQQVTRNPAMRPPQRSTQVDLDAMRVLKGEVVCIFVPHGDGRH